MGQYLRGDVLLAAVALDDRTAPKTRPVVVIASDNEGHLRACPVSSKPPNDAPCLPLTIDDFESGGLDLFSESYVMVSRVLVLRAGDPLGKKGRLTRESLAEIAARAPAPESAGTREMNRSATGRFRSRR